MPSPLDHDSQLVVDFCNTLDVDDGTDVLDSPSEYGGWLVDHQLATSPVDRSRREIDDARRLRATLRAVAAREDATDVDVAVSIRITGDGSVDLTSPDPVGAIAASAARLAIEGRFQRVKICPADDCRWTFYDQSRNASGRWCSMQACGNRAKVRASRARARQL